MDYLLLLGDQASATFLSRLIYWIPKTNNPDGWVYKTQEEWEIELGLSPKRQRTARKKLKSLGIIEERKIGIPCQLQYRVNFDSINKIKEKFQPIEKLKQLMAQVKKSWNHLLCRGLSQIARNFLAEIKDAITIGLKNRDFSKAYQLEKKLSQSWKKMNNFTNDPNNNNNTSTPETYTNIPGTHTNTLHYKRKVAANQTVPSWANHPDAPWTSEEWQRFAQALLQYANQLNYQNPTGFVNRVADNTVKIGTSVEWQEFKQGNEIGSIVKAEWEHLRGIPYPAFTQYATRQLQEKNMSLEQAASELGKILKFNASAASELWRAFSQRVVNADKEAKLAKKRGITPSIPPELKVKASISPEESASAYKRLMALDKKDQSCLSTSTNTPQALPQALPQQTQSQVKQAADLNDSSRVTQAEDISPEQQAKNYQRLQRLMQEVGKKMKRGKEQPKLTTIEELNTSLSDSLLRADSIHQARAERFRETGAEVIRDNNGLICKVVEVDF